MIDENYKLRLYKQYLNLNKIPLRSEIIKNFKSRKHYINRVIKYFFPKDRNSRILDIGCGSGAFLYFAHEAGYRNISGIDASEQQVMVANEVGLKIAIGDIFTGLKGEKTDSIDCIIAFDVLEHFKKNEVVDFADEVHRVLKKGGRWIIHVPNAESIFFGKILYGDFSHEIAFTENSLKQLLAMTGFSNISIYEDYPVVHGLKSFVRFLLWKIIRSILKFYIVIESGHAGKGIYTQNLFVLAVKDNEEKATFEKVPHRSN